MIKDTIELQHTHEHNHTHKLIFVTCGANSRYFRNGKASGDPPCLTGIHVVDTTGAGIFSAVTLSG